MARSVIKLEGEEIEFFHANYFYMWKKLNTAPYYVSGSGEMPSWIKEPELLPSYVNLSKCMNPTYVPSVNIVNKIVAFYNANIQPEVNTFQFLHEKLEATDEQRHTGNNFSVDEYNGLYYAYYFSAISDQKKVYGATLKISTMNNVTTVQMVSGLSTREDMKGMRLRSLFEKNDISVTDYKKYKDSLPLAKRRTALYKGVVQATQSSLTFQMQSADMEGNFLICQVAAEAALDNQYLGGIGMLTMLNGNNGLEILKVGLERADHKDLRPLMFEDPKLIDILCFQKTENEHIHLSAKDNTSWNNLLIDSCNNAL